MRKGNEAVFLGEYSAGEFDDGEFFVGNFMRGDFPRGVNKKSLLFFLE